jgi:hypothetical protein
MFDCDTKVTDKKGTMTGPFLRKSALSDRLRRENGDVYLEAFSALKAGDASLFFVARDNEIGRQNIGDHLTTER